MNTFELSRNWFDFSFHNPDKVKPNHTAIYFFAIEHCNRLGGKEKFGFPTTMVMEALGIKSYNTYIDSFNDLVMWGFFKLIEKSKNQYSANIIALSKNDKALDKAMIKHTSKQSESTIQSIDSINKQETINNKQVIVENQKRFSEPTILEIKNYCEERKNNVDFNKFYDFYKSKGWMVGKNKMKDWQAAVRTWEKESSFKKTEQKTIEIDRKNPNSYWNNLKQNGTN